MSKRFKAQDYFRYKRLGKRWRRPVGWQSKLRLGKGGSGIKPAMGYRTSKSLRGTSEGVNVVIVNNADDLAKVGKGVALIASGVGAKKTMLIHDKAKQLGVRIINMKKVKHARNVARSIEKKRAEKKTEKEKAKENKEKGKEAAKDAKKDNKEVEKKEEANKEGKSE